MNKRQIARAKERAIKNAPLSQRVVFDEHGNMTSLYKLQSLETFQKEGNVSERIKEHMASNAEELARVDVTDREVAREKRREKRRAKKERERGMKAFDGEGQTAYFVPPGDDYEGDDYEGDGGAYYSDSDHDDRVPQKKQRTLQDDEALALQLLGSY
ncbi:hypothetical protein GQ42DRAFT_76504 [Ramicandelaber brevisporus]|nr:hypothetical protein GQ42DRAFT_76504 [Ramicandelaber brevisporus]